MNDLEARYRRLLRWYPRTWRAAHGEFLIGTAMDAADAEGRSRPTPAEVRSMSLHGFGERFTLGVALAAAVGALLFAFAGMLVLVTGVGTVAPAGGGWIPLALNFFGAAVCASVSTLALLRHAGLRPDRVLPALALAVLAWACAFFAAWSWSVGFDEADEGLVRTPFSLAFGAFLLAGWIIGGAASALVVDATARSLPRVVRRAAAGMAAVVCPPVFAILAYPLTSGLVVALVLVAASVILLTRRDEAHRNAVTSDPMRVIPPRLRHQVGILSLPVAALGAVCAAFALTGGVVMPGIDATVAMQLGLGAGALAGIPLVFAAAWLLSTRRPRRTGLIVCSALLIALGMITQGVMTLLGAATSGEIPWVAVVTLTVGVGILTAALVRATPVLRILLGIAAGMTALLPVWLVVAAAGFIVPVAAIAVAAWGLRRSGGSPSPAPVRIVEIP